nr:MAG TPA: hypothetical protein [Caudoviricetes sp.]
MEQRLECGLVRFGFEQRSFELEWQRWFPLRFTSPSEVITLRGYIQYRSIKGVILRYCR